MRRLFLSAAVFMVVVTLMLLWGIPRLVEHFVRDRIATTTGYNTDLKIDSLSPWYTSASDIRIDGPDFNAIISGITLQYFPEELLSGELENVVLDRPALRLSLTARVMPSSNGEVSVQTGGDVFSSRFIPPFKLPVRNITMLDGLVVVTGLDNETLLEASVNSFVSREYDEQVSFSCDVASGGDSLYAEGEYSSEKGDGEMSFHFVSPNLTPLVDDLHVIVQNKSFPGDLSLEGDTDIKGAIQLEQGLPGLWGVSLESSDLKATIVEYDLHAASLFMGGQGRADSINTFTLSGKKLSAALDEFSVSVEDTIIRWNKSGKLKGQIPRFSFDTTNSTKLTGDAHADLHLDLNKASLDGVIQGSSFKLTIDDEPFTGKEFRLDGSFSAINTAFSFGLKDLVFMDLSWEAIRAQVNIVDNRKANIKQLGFSGMGGKFQFDPILLDDLEEPAFRTKVKFTGIDLGKLNQFLGLFDGQVTGKADGWLLLTWNNQRLTLHDGMLTLSKTNGGTLRYKNPGWLTGGQKSKGLVQKQLNLAEQTMEDMIIDNFLVDLFPDAHPDKDLRIEIYGHGSDGDPRKVVDYGANFTVPAEILSNSTIKKILNLGLEITWERELH